MRLLAIVPVLFFITKGESQSVSPWMGARVNGMANTVSGIQDEYALFNNPAGISEIAGTRMLAANQVSPDLVGANRMAAGFLQQLGPGTTGIGVFQFGDTFYNEQLLSLTYANKLGLASLGIRLSYVQYNTGAFGRRGGFSVTFGGIANLTPELSVGALVTNINKAVLSESDHQVIPMRALIGMVFRVSDNLLISSEIEKDLDYEAKVKSGLEFDAGKKILLRTGFLISPETAYFGVGFHVRSLTIDVASEFNPLTRLKHQLSFVYHFRRK